MLFVKAIFNFLISKTILFQVFNFTKFRFNSKIKIIKKKKAEEETSLHYAYIYLAPLATLRAFGFYLCFTSNFCMLNNSVPSKFLSSANGWAMTVANLQKFLGPLIFAPLYAWSISKPRVFPFNVWLFFVYAFLMMGMGGLFLTRRIPRFLEDQARFRN